MCKRSLASSPKDIHVFQEQFGPEGRIYDNVAPQTSYNSKLVQHGKTDMKTDCKYVLVWFLQIYKIKKKSIFNVK